MNDTARRTFDRTKDVAKLLGCNTRNVNYRWSIFGRYLDQIPKGSRVLDFGAGSLRETFELSLNGFNVVSFDLNEATMKAYYADYNWADCSVQPTLIAGSDLSQVTGEQFTLITAFDVFEHLNQPKELLIPMIDLLTADGLIFCTVPNRRTLFEILSRIKWKGGLALGQKFNPGEPHIQFNSPAEWRAIFESSGLKVVEHEMAIGFFVNTWASIVSVITLPARRLVPRLFHREVEIDRLGVLAAPRVMSVLNAIDRRTEKMLQGLYGWNLFVLSPIKQDR
jgi:2-polyprenyl-6-hydroxyphenyl methylase/3-demethylubiquinone-9 3-methyltransferase